MSRRPRQSHSRSPGRQSSGRQSSSLPPPSPNRNTVSTLLGRASGSGQIPSAHDGHREIGPNLTLTSFARNQEHPAVPMPARRQAARTHHSPVVADGSTRRGSARRSNGTSSMLGGDSWRPSRGRRYRGYRRSQNNHNNHNNVNGYNTRSTYNIHTDPHDPNLFRSYLRDMNRRRNNNSSNPRESPIEDSELDSDEQLEQATSQYIYTQPDFYELNVDLSIEVAAVNHRLREAGQNPRARLEAFLEFFAEEGVRGATTIRGPRHPDFPHQTTLHSMFDDLRQEFVRAGRNLVDEAHEFASLQDLEDLQFFIELEMHALGAALDYFTTGSSDRSSLGNQREASDAAEQLRAAYERSSSESRRIRELRRELVRTEVERERQPTAAEAAATGSPGSSRAPRTSRLLSPTFLDTHRRLFGDSTQQTAQNSSELEHLRDRIQEGESAGHTPSPIVARDSLSDENEPGSSRATGRGRRRRGSG